MNILYILYLMVRRPARYLRYLSGTGLLILLAACNEDSGLIPEPPEPEVPQETAYVSLSVNIGDAFTTRSHTGTPEERYVQGVRLVLYNGNQDASTVVRCIDYEIKTAESGSDVWTGTGLAPNQINTSRFVTYAEEVPRMDYYALALINPTTAMKESTEKGKTLSTFTAAREVETAGKTTDVGGLAAAKNFPMTNTQGLVPVEETVHLQPSRNAAHNNPVGITVQRMVAKVTLTTENGGVTIPCHVDGALAGNLSWGLDITNRWTFWMRRGTENVGDLVDMWYARDPNYEDTSQDNEANRAKEFFYYHSLGSTIGTLSGSLNSSEYCLENTMDDNEQAYDNVATRVFIKCVYKPKYVSTLGQGYYLFTPQGAVYTHEDMKVLLEVAYEEKKINKLSAISKAILDAHDDGYNFGTGGVPQYNNSTVNASFQTHGIKYYHNGVNYYAIKIRHFGAGDSGPFTHGHYGVLRNTHYTVKLELIGGPGAIDLEDAGISTRAATAAGSDLYSNIEATIIVNNQL